MESKRKMWIIYGLIILVLISAIIAIVFLVIPKDNKNNINKNNEIINEDIKENVEVHEEEKFEKLEETELKRDKLKTTSDKGKKFEEKIEFIDENEEKAVVPIGYAVVNDSPSISEGLVISDKEDDDIHNKKLGNQFVWIPIQDTYIDVRNCKDEDEINNRIMEEVRKDKNPMFLRLSDGNYKGILYRFKEIDEGTKVILEFIDYTTVRNEREPSNLNEDKDVIKDWKKDLFQEEFNDMAKEIIKNKGFWIGRFETSASEENIAQSKRGQNTKTNATWYELYELQKTLSNENVKSHMIWGCQWDQVMKWLKYDSGMGKKEINHYILNSTNMGNYLDTEIKVLVDEKGKKKEKVFKRDGEALRIATGIFSIKNIYDLAGNVWEWTMEANYTSRTARGGDCSFYGSKYPASSRFSFQPTYSDKEKIDLIGSRMIIY